MDDLCGISRDICILLRTGGATTPRAAGHSVLSVSTGQTFAHTVHPTQIVWGFQETFVCCSGLEVQAPLELLVTVMLSINRSKVCKHSTHTDIQTSVEGTVP